MRERVTAVAAIAVAGGFLGVCCGLPVLLSVGVLGAVAGVSVSSGVLTGLGLGLALLGWARWVRHRRITTGAASCVPTAHTSAPRSTLSRVISITKEHYR